MDSGATTTLANETGNAEEREGARSRNRIKVEGHRLSAACGLAVWIERESDAALEQIAEHLSVPLMLVTYGNPLLRDDQRLAELGVRVTIDGHGAYFAAIKATYDSLREQRQIFTQGADLSATELTHTYTQPEEYIRWAEEFMQVKE